MWIEAMELSQLHQLPYADVTKIEKNMLRSFDHVEKMNERRLTKDIYEADSGGSAVKGRLSEHFLTKFSKC
jgi:hypothetical protein